MKNLYQNYARTRWDGSGGIFRKCAVLLLAVSLLPGTSAAGSEPVWAMPQTEVPPPARERTVGGTVRDGKGDPIPGAAVTVVGGSLGVSTDASGAYRIEGVGGDDELEFSFLGMMSQKEKVGTRTRIDVTLREDMIGLEDVVVTGYTAMKRKDITGSVASVSAEQIARIPAYDLTTSLVGVAGIRIDGGSIRIRGTRSTNAGNDPLIVLDGIPYDETLTSINPGDIESIDILKDASSTAIYGAKGANGVILITTKQARKGETKVIYDGFVGVGVNNRGTLDVMDADEYIAFQREASRAAGGRQQGLLRGRDRQHGQDGYRLDGPLFRPETPVAQPLADHRLGQREDPVQGFVQLQEQRGPLRGRPPRLLLSDHRPDASGAAVPEGGYLEPRFLQREPRQARHVRHVPPHVAADADLQRGRLLQRVSVRRPVREEPLHERNGRSLRGQDRGVEDLHAFLRTGGPLQGTHLQHQLRLHAGLLVARLLLRQPQRGLHRRAQRRRHAQQPQGRLGMEQHPQLQEGLRQARHRRVGRLRDAEPSDGELLDVGKGPGIARLSVV